MGVFPWFSQPPNHQPVYHGIFWATTHHLASSFHHLVISEARRQPEGRQVRLDGLLRVGAGVEQPLHLGTGGTGMEKVLSKWDMYGNVRKPWKKWEKLVI